MYSMKPGRGPSFMGGIASIGAAIFGIFWMIMAAKMGAPTLFVMFGLVFIIMAIVQAVYHFYNTGAKNRMSSIDIVKDNEEPDPINKIVGGELKYCSKCGNKILDMVAKYCSKCGNKLG